MNSSEMQKSSRIKRIDIIASKRSRRLFEKQGCLGDSSRRKQCEQTLYHSPINAKEDPYTFVHGCSRGSDKIIVLDNEANSCAPTEDHDILEENIMLNIKEGII